MTFCQRLQDYMHALKCTPAELVARSGVSASTISRYRAGTRTPAAGSPQFAQIVSGLAQAAAAIGRELPEETIRRELLDALGEVNPLQIAALRIRLNTLIDQMHLNARQMADAVGMAYSVFFRIRSGQRRPTDPEGFCRLAAQFVAQNLRDELSREIAADILDCTPAQLETREAAQAMLAHWLLHGAERQRQHAHDFLVELDRFDLEQYITSFDRSPRLPESAAVGSVRFAEEAFIRTLPPAEPDETAYVCTDLFASLTTQTAERVQAPEYITAMLIRKGYRVRLVFNTDQPTDALLRRLESLMPVFMTGKLEAFYLKGRQDDVYRSRLIALETAAICIEAVQGYEAQARTRIARDAADVSYYRSRAEQIFSFACPLIEIIDRDETKRAAAVRDDPQKPGRRVSLLSTPPIYTISSELLDRILARGGTQDEDAARIRQYIASERARVLHILRHTEMIDRIPDVPESAYADRPIFLSLSGLFFDREIFYTFDEYRAHMSLTRAFERQHERYHVAADGSAMFRNMQIFINEGYWIMLSKNRTPAIHLFIRHPKLRRSFENMLLI